MKDMFQSTGISKSLSAAIHKIHNVEKHTSVITKKYCEQSHSLTELSNSLLHLGQKDGGSSLDEAVVQLASSVSQIAAETERSVQMKRIKVDYPLQDTLRYIASVKTALQRRERCREAYANAVACVTAVEESVKHHSSDKEVQAARAKSERLTADMKEAERELGEVTARLIPDLERVRREVATEIRWVLLAFTDIQIEYNRNCEAMWADAVPSLQAANQCPAELPSPPHPPTRPSTASDN
eukprot:gene759-843_t